MNKETEEVIKRISTPGECWKLYKDNPKYLVSNMGRVFSITKNDTMYLEPRDGYLRVVIYEKGKRIRVFVHRMVAETFLPKDNERTVVNHINGIKGDNRLSNLEWVTHRENSIHAFESGLQKHKALNSYDIDDIMDMFVEGVEFKHIAEKFDCQIGTIRRLVAQNKKYYSEPVYIPPYMENEWWLPIKGFYGVYEVCLDGRIRNVTYDYTNGGRKNKILTPHITQSQMVYELCYKMRKKRVAIELNDIEGSAKKYCSHQERMVA